VLEFKLFFGDKLTLMDVCLGDASGDFDFVFGDFDFNDLGDFTNVGDFDFGDVTVFIFNGSGDFDFNDFGDFTNVGDFDLLLTDGVFCFGLFVIKFGLSSKVEKELQLP
jgi:hypothetical protein